MAMLHRVLIVSPKAFLEVCELMAISASAAASASLYTLVARASRSVVLMPQPVFATNILILHRSALTNIHDSLLRMSAGLSGHNLLSLHLRQPVRRAMLSANRHACQSAGAVLP
jgi:hypothetical protein